MTRTNVPRIARDLYNSFASQATIGCTVSVDEALAALERIAGREAVARVRFEPDPAIEKIVLGWPARFRTVRAHELGFEGDRSIDEIIRRHLRYTGRDAA